MNDSGQTAPVPAVPEAATQDDDASANTNSGASLWSQFSGGTPARFRPLCAAVADFESSSRVDNNFLKDVKWSPDGLCLLASSDDNAIRLFEPGGAAEDSAQLEETWRMPHHDRLKSALKVQEGETIYDLAWLPTMTSADPASCCFFSTSRDNPVHVWDAFTGQCRGSYCAYTDAEELTAGYCIAFNSHAGSEQMYVGFNNCVRVFDLSRPGREHRIVPTFKRANRETSGQRGIISCIAFNPDKSGLYACGSYSRNVGLYAAPKGNLLYNLQGQRGGITQVLWSRDGNYLFSGGRKDREILCWDVRNTGDVLLSLPRIVSTNQRLQFDLDHSGRYLVTPSHGSSGHRQAASRAEDEAPANGVLRIYDLWGQGAAVAGEVSCPSPWISGVSLHPTQPILAGSVGARRFQLPQSLVDGGSDGEDVAAAGTKRLRDEGHVVGKTLRTGGGICDSGEGEVDGGLLLWQLLDDSAVASTS